MISKPKHFVDLPSVVVGALNPVSVRVYGCPNDPVWVASPKRHGVLRVFVG